MVAYRKNKITKSSRQKNLCLELFYKHLYEKYPYEVFFYFVIFSCFTLWSIMWRDANSLWTSSTVMPICTINTIA